MTCAPESVCARLRALRAVLLGSTVLWLTVGSTFAQTATPAYPDPDWPVSTPEAEGMDPVKFADAMANMPSIAIVIRNGKIIATKGDITRPGPLYSGSKALLATLAALSMQQGKITMETLVPGSDVPTVPLAAMKHFLTMTSDFNLTPHSPGDHYAYSNSGAIHYGSYLIYTFYPGLSEVQAMRTAYLDKLGIQDPFSLVGAISGWGGGGFVMSTRDLARLGYLILRNGVWKGERLMPQWFIDGLYMNQIPAAATPGGTGSGEYDNQVNVTPRLPGTYSWGFWIPNGAAGYEGSRSNTVACTVTGSYGTSMHVIPKYDMILAGVNTVSTMTGGRISGALIDQFAAAVLPPAPTGDTTYPWVKMTSPANGATVSGTITISATASDNVAVQSVQFFLDGMPLGAPHTTAPYSVNWNSLTVPDGQHVIGARVLDTSGNDDSAIPVTINVSSSVPPASGDATPPTVSITSPVSGAVVSGSVTISANASDNVGVVGVQFLIDGQSLGAEDTTPPYSILWNTASASPGTHTITARARDAAGNSADATISVTSWSNATSGFRFVPIVPCRVLDTRGAAGPFGGPAISAGQTRDFPIPSSQCGIPADAHGYSLNVTAVPSRQLGYLTVWPAGQSRPLASTLNSLDGRVKANAAIVGAGTGGALSVYATDRTDVVFDINGYFVSPDKYPSALAFYPLPPCRLVDTRTGAGALSANETRDINVSQQCGMPFSAAAYSLNITAVPSGPLGYVTVWPAGNARPLASALNAPTGAVTANAAIVEAGTGGSVSVFTTHPTDLVIDVNGYFAPPGSGGLSLYVQTPCRVIDTRNPDGPFGGPSLVGTRGFMLPDAGCHPPAASAYSVNATVVPHAALGYLTLWPAADTQPVVSTLNALDGYITSNAAIVPASGGAIKAFTTDPADLVVDLNGYFAP